MTIEEAMAELQERVLAVSPQAVLRTKRRNDDQAIMRVYAPADEAENIQTAVRDRTIALLTSDGLDVQVLVYDIATSLPPDEGTS